MNLHKNRLTRPSHFFGLLLNNFSHRFHSADGSQTDDNNKVASQTDEESLHLRTIKQARRQLIASFNDLVTILESFHEVYTHESTHRSALCERYQRQAIYYATAVIEKSMQDGADFNLPFEMMHHSDAYQLFNTLKQLKNYQLEMPEGWYENVKHLLNHISAANHYYQHVKKHTAH